MPLAPLPVSLPTLPTIGTPGGPTAAREGLSPAATRAVGYGVALVLVLLALGAIGGGGKRAVDSTLRTVTT